MVLTSPQRWFVDVRLLLPLPAESPVRVAKDVDWAFAGTSSHDDAAEPPHSVFKHWIDSRHVEADAVRDEGDMYAGASDAESIEKGRMVNPATNAEEVYEECWVDGIGSKDCSGYVLKYENGNGRGLMVKIGNVVQGVLRIEGRIGLVRWELSKDSSKKVIAEVGYCEAFPKEDLGRTEESNFVETSHGQRWNCIEKW
jgi:hypothetical protein